MRRLLLFRGPRYSGGPQQHKPLHARLHLCFINPNPQTLNPRGDPACPPAAAAAAAGPLRCTYTRKAPPAHAAPTATSYLPFSSQGAPLFPVLYPVGAPLGGPLSLKGLLGGPPQCSSSSMLGVDVSVHRDLGAPRCFCSSKSTDHGGPSLKPIDRVNSEALAALPEDKIQTLEDLGPKTLEEARENRLRSFREQGLTLPGGVVDRYLPPRDPSALLLEPHKLTKEEQRFQILFTVLPWFFFGCMLAAPLCLAHYHRKKMQERRGSLYAASLKLQERFNLPVLLLLHFYQLQQLVEQPYEVLLLLLNSAAFGAHTAACIFTEVALLLRQHGIELPVAICDIGEAANRQGPPGGPPRGPPGGPPGSGGSKFAAAAAPYLFMLLPDGLEGEPAAIEIEELKEEKILKSTINKKTAQTLIKHIATIRPAAGALLKEAEAIDAAAADLLRCEFADVFVDQHANHKQNNQITTPSGGPPRGAPQQGPPMRGPHEGPPAGAPQQGPPMGGPHEGSPTGAPQQGTPRGVPHEGPPMGAPQQVSSRGASQGGPPGGPQGTSGAPACGGPTDGGPLWGIAYGGPSFEGLNGFRGDEGPLRVWRLQEALSACRERRRKKYETVLV